MSEEAIRRIRERFPNEAVLIVLADHRTCTKLSESVFRELWRMHPHRTVMAGYEYGSTGGDVFYTDGVPVAFNADDYDAVREEFPQLKMRRGRIYAVYVGEDTVRRMYLGSSKTNIVNKLVNFTPSSAYIDTPMSSASIAVALIFLVMLILIGLCAAFFLLTDSDTRYAGVRIVFLIIGVAIVIIILMDRVFIQGTFKTEYPDLDLAMVLSFIPGLGLLYLKRIRGLLLPALTALNVYLIYFVFCSGTFTLPIESMGLIMAFFFIPLYSFLCILYVSLMETQYFCMRIGGNDWNSVMTRTVEPHERYILGIFYIILAVVIVIFVRDYYEYAYTLLALSAAYPLYEWYSRKHR